MIVDNHGFPISQPLETDAAVIQIAKNLPTPPKKASDNIAYRRWVKEQTDPNQNSAAHLWRRAFFHRCKDKIDGCSFWTDTFNWTSNPKLGDISHIPFVLWPFQDEVVTMLVQAILQGESMVVDKTREMGASWLVMDVLGWFWMFNTNGNFLVGSREKDLVDGKSLNPLLPKLDYILKYQPSWILPVDKETGKVYSNNPPYRISMNIQNPWTGSTIVGEATKKDFGRGGRGRATILDEHGSMANARDIQAGVALNGNCFISISTPKGRGTHQAKLRFSGLYKVRSIHWTENPLWLPKGYPDSVWSEDELKRCWPKHMICKTNCPIHPQGGRPHSERYDKECKELGNDPVLIAQELDIDYAKAGVCPFRTDLTSKCFEAISKHPPEFTYKSLIFDIPPDNAFRRAPANMDEFYETAATWGLKSKTVEGGNFKIWKKPFSCRDTRCRCRGTGRHTYVAGGDVSKGLPTGDYSCLYVLDITTEEVVAEWYGKLDPDELAIEWAKVAKYYGTHAPGNVKPPEDCYCAIEWNDQGLIVNKIMDRLGVPLYLCRSEDKVRNKFQNRLGVLTSKSTKVGFVMNYLQPEVNHVEEDGFPRLVCPFKEFWAECETMISIAPAGEIESLERRLGAAYGNHDDRVMAMCFALLAGMDGFEKIRNHVREEWLDVA